MKMHDQANTMGGEIARLILVVCLSGTAVAGPLDDATEAYTRGDFDVAAKLLILYAEQGSAYEQAILGMMYDYGQGVPQDYAQAAKWYRAAAEQGYAHAQYLLGDMHTRGEGVSPDYVQAHKWLSLSASRYPLSEEKSRAKAERLRDTIASEMTAAQIAKAQLLAGEWKPK
jgi:TPR repeat protein